MVVAVAQDSHRKSGCKTRERTANAFVPALPDESANDVVALKIFEPRIGAALEILLQATLGDS